MSAPSLVWLWYENITYENNHILHVTSVSNSRSGHYFGVIGTTGNLKIPNIIALKDDEADIMVVT